MSDSQFTTFTTCCWLPFLVLPFSHSLVLCTIVNTNKHCLTSTLCTVYSFLRPRVGYSAAYKSVSCTGYLPNNFKWFILLNIFQTLKCPSSGNILKLIYLIRKCLLQIDCFFLVSISYRENNLSKLQYLCENLHYSVQFNNLFSLSSSNAHSIHVMVGIGQASSVIEINLDIFCFNFIKLDKSTFQNNRSKRVL